MRFILILRKNNKLCTLAKKNSQTTKGTEKRNNKNRNRNIIEWIKVSTIYEKSKSL